MIQQQSTSPRLIVGLGNPGREYIATRHNTGFWAIDAIAKLYAVNLNLESKFGGDIAKVVIGGSEVFLLKPATYMNLSGKSVLAVANFYKISVNEIMVIHDELDFTPGLVKLKFGGGSGGHNGLRDIERVLGRDFWRIRIGIGHPQAKHKVHDYVLNVPNPEDKIAIDRAIDKLLDNLNYILAGNFAQALKNIHTQ